MQLTTSRSCNLRFRKRRLRVDDERIAVPGARDVRDVLSTDPIFRLARRVIANPIGLGLVLFALAVVAIVFGPATGARFIYTDF